MDIAIAGIQYKRAEEIMTIPWAVDLKIGSKSTFYEKSKQSSLIEVIQERVFPWPNKTDPTDENDILKEKDILIKQEKTSTFSLTPLVELKQISAFCLFQVFSTNDKKIKRDYLSQLGIYGLNLIHVRVHFEQTPAYRMKPVKQEASLKRLLERFLQLPRSWQDALRNNNQFFVEDTFENARELINHFVERMTIKVEDTKDPQSTSKEFDVICHHLEEATKILELCKTLNLSYSFKFQAPTSGKKTLQEWQSGLNISPSSLPNFCIMKSTVNNLNGRLTIRLERDNEKRSKDIEAYLWITMLNSYFKLIL
jgi:hypothetical protein